MIDPQPFAPKDGLAGSSNSLRRYWPVLLVPVIGLIGWFGSQPVTITLLYGATWATYAVGYDMFSGFSGRVNLGYAMFPATAAYVTAVLSARLKIAPALSIPAGIAAALLLAVVVGALTLRITGIYFALSTSIIPLALFQLTHVFGKFLGGEEGIWGVPPIFTDPRLDLVVVLLILGASMCFALWYVRSKAGLVLRAIQGGELTAQALGLNTFRFLFVSLLVSAAIGATAGAYLALMGPEGMREVGDAILARSQYALQVLSRIHGVSITFRRSSHFREFVVDFRETGKTVREINRALLQQGIFGGRGLSLSQRYRTRWLALECDEQ